jgi:hypothetical protein
LQEDDETLDVLVSGSREISEVFTERRTEMRRGDVLNNPERKVTPFSTEDNMEGENLKLSHETAH